MSQLGGLASNLKGGYPAQIMFYGALGHFSLSKGDIPSAEAF